MTLFTKFIKAICYQKLVRYKMLLSYMKTLPCYHWHMLPLNLDKFHLVSFSDFISIMKLSYTRKERLETTQNKGGKGNRREVSGGWERRGGKVDVGRKGTKSSRKYFI